MSYELTMFIPCFNERDNILSTLSTIEKALSTYTFNFEILLFNDGSTDDTSEVALKHALNNNLSCNLRIINKRTNKGLGHRYLQAAKISGGKYFMLINGDNVETVSQITNILNHRGEQDIVIPYFGKNDSRSIYRVNLSKIFTFVINIISGNRIKYYNGAVLHKTKNLSNLNLRVSGYAYQCEILCTLIGKGHNYIEVEVKNSERQWGVSKAFRITNFISVAKSAIRIAKQRYTNHRI